MLREVAALREATQGVAITDGDEGPRLRVLGALRVASGIEDGAEGVVWIG